MRKNKLWIALAAAALVAAFIWPTGRTPRNVKGSAEGDREDGVRAAVVRVQRGTIENSLRIAGEFKPFQEVDLHAKVAGYIRKIYVDVGDHVKEGQTIAVLEIPELAAELAGADAAVRRSQEEIRRAEGEVQRMRSAHDASHSARERLEQAAATRPGIVAQQEVDDARAKDLESEAQVASAQAALSAAQQQLEVAQANQKQYGALADYSRIAAPFAGVVTTRYADTGALIAAGTSSSTQAMPVVRLAQVSRLRLVLPIPESAAAQIRLGDAVKVHVQAVNEETVGTVSRFADSLDRQTRTMDTEIDFDNRTGRLMPGMYAEAQVLLQGKKGVLCVPVEALARNGDDATVLAVNAQNVVEERHVKLGLESAAQVEVLSGLSENERVIVGRRSEFRSGQKVLAKEVSNGAGKAQGED